ncbi:MAG TPA: tetratricopeptide repeat protein [Terriglobales bacterium]|nr:tetratricopeptide repeat protein [Terriglobales bacterium]
MAGPPKIFYEFDSFRIDPEERVLMQNGSPIPLNPKAFEILTILVRHCERVVLKDDLMKQLWPDSFVEEANLTQNIFMLRKALGESGRSYRYVVTVPGRGYRFAVKVAEVSDREIDPSPAVTSRRIPDESALSRPAEPSPGRSPGMAEKSSARRSLILAASVMVIVLLGGGFIYRHFWTLSHPVNASPLGPAIPVRRSVAVLGFQNISGQADEIWLSTAISEMLSTELAAGDELRMISGEDIARMKQELPWKGEGSLAKDTLERIHRNLGSDFLVLGSYTVLGEKGKQQLRLDLRLQDARNGEIVAELGETGTEANLFDLLSSAGEQLRGRLSVPGVSPADAGIVRASLPSNPEAARLYSEGLARLRVLDALAARDLLQKATALDPRHPLSHSALAQALSLLGFDERAKEEAKSAFDLAKDQPREQQLWIEGRYREFSKDWKKATEVYTTLYTFTPDNLEYGLRLAASQDGGGNSKDALATVATLRNLPPPERDDPRIDLAEADAAESLSDFHRAQQLAESAAKKGEAQGSPLLTARALQRECYAFKSLSQIKQATGACESAKKIADKIGDRSDAAWALNNLASIASDEGNLTEAKKMYLEALAVFRQIGSKIYTAGVLGNLAIIELNQGDLTASRQMHEESLKIYREIGNVNDAGLELMNIALILQQQGDLEEARTMYEGSLAMARQAENKASQEMALVNLGGLMYELGDLGNCQKTQQEAASLGREIGEQSILSYATVGLGDVLRQEGDLDGARKKYEESLAIRDRLGEKEAAAQSRVALALVSIEEGKLDDAERSAREATDEFRAQKALADEAAAQIVLARVSLARKQTSAAKQAIDRALTLAQTSHSRDVHLSARVIAARIRAESAGAVEAIRELKEASAEARKIGFLEGDFQARLAIGEIEMHSGQSVTGRTQLLTLQQDAKAKNFNLLAQKAAAGIKN